MTRIVSRISLLIFSLALTACWGSTSNVNYESYNAYTDQPNVEFVQKGRVVEDGWAHYVGFCDRASKAALKDAITSAKGMGANALTDVKWISAGGEFQTPHCESFFLIYWWGATTEMSASAVYIEDMEEPSGVVYQFDPAESSAAIATKMLATIRSRDADRRSQ